MTPERFSHPYSKETPSFSVEQVFVAGNYGPCGGVNMAIQTTEEVLRMVKKREPVFTFNPIVHNHEVMNEFSQMGLSLVKDWNEIPNGSVIIFSAHGVTLEDRKKAEEISCIPVDTTCQLVDFVHRKVEKVIKEGYRVIYVGSRRDDGSLHPEPAGVISKAEAIKPGAIIFISNRQELNQCDFSKDQKLTIFAQTTLSTKDTEETIKEARIKWPWIDISRNTGNCYATDNRQQAVVELAKKLDLIIVHGSGDISHNTKMLAKRAQELSKTVIQVENENRLNEKDLQEANRVGYIAGASVPVEKTIRFLNWFSQRDVKIIYEDQVVEEKDLVFVKPVEDLDRLRVRLIEKYGH